jgi:tetratricopeptide (TPR) repeat protein
MRRAFTLAFLTFCLCGLAASQSQLLVGRLVDVSKRPPVPVDGAKVRVLDTGQEAVTKDGGRFQFSLPPAKVAGSEVQIEVKAGNLRAYRPPNGIVTVPAPGAKPVEVQLLPAGSRLFLEPAAIEALLAQASKPPPDPERKDSGHAVEREPRLQRFLRQWAADYGFGLEDVEREVKAWGDQIRAHREEASVRQQALAEFQAQHFAQAAVLFKESASAEAAVLDRIETEQDERDQAERWALRQFLDDKIRAAAALTLSLKYEDAERVLRGAAKRVSRDRYGAWWTEMQLRWGSALLVVGFSGKATQSIVSLRDTVTAFQNALQAYTKESPPQGWAADQNDPVVVHLTLRERGSGAEEAESVRVPIIAYARREEPLPQEWAQIQNNLGVACLRLAQRVSGPEAEESLRAAVTAFQKALLVYTRESLPQEWAMTQNNLASAYVSQERWEEAAQAVENVLTLYPTSIEGLARAEGIYQDRLFRFDRAFELNAKRVELGNGELDFIEKHLTTARFEGCATRGAALRIAISEKEPRVVLTALRFACLVADQKTEDAGAAGRQLAKDISGLEKVHRTFRGVKHFVSQHPAFAVKAAEWTRLLEALEQGDELKARVSLTALGVTE